MEKISRTYILAISIAIIGLTWMFALIAYHAMSFALPWRCWGSITCMAFALIVAELYLLLYQRRYRREMTEAGALGTILSVAYLLLVGVFNSIFAALNFGHFNWLLLAVNSILLAVYLVLLLWADASNARLARQLQAMEEKKSFAAELSRKIGEALALTEDAELRLKLLKLKEAVDYSSNISIAVNEGNEARLYAQLEELVHLMHGRADRQLMFQQLEMVEISWRLCMNRTASLSCAEGVCNGYRRFTMSWLREHECRIRFEAENIKLQSMRQGGILCSLDPECKR